MAVHVRCPHCATKCAVAADLIGVPVLCGHCQRSFAVRSPLAKLPALPPAVPPTPLRLEIAGVTATGRVRTHNEDNFAAHHLTWSVNGQRRDAAFLVIADGLGGHEAGAEASMLVVRTALASLLPVLTSAIIEGKSHLLPSPTEAIEQVLHQANGAIQAQIQKERRAKGMGATAAVMLLWNDIATIGHVGDTRVSYVRNRQLTQITRDQTVTARMVELGRLSPREAMNHPARHDVLQAVGHHSELKPTTYEVKLAQGDWLIAASDGLHTDVDGDALCQLVTAEPASAKALALRLVEAAEERGGSDNCTVVVVRCE